MTQQSTINFIGYVAATCTTISFLPQLISGCAVALGERDIAGDVFDLLGGDSLVADLRPALALEAVAAANAVTLVLSMSILIMKLRFDHEAVKEVRGI